MHSLVTTPANASDISQMPQLLHGQEREVYGDQAYWSEVHRQRARRRRGSAIASTAGPTVNAAQRRISGTLNRLRSATRARGEHAFHVVKRLWGFTKVRYRGLAKNTARLFTAFALANLYMLRRRLMPVREACRC